MHYRYKTKYTCSTFIDFDLDGDVVTNIVFTGGCNGNLKAISKLVDGWTVEKIESFLRGNTCGMRPTSCADQLALAVREGYGKALAAGKQQPKRDSGKGSNGDEGEEL